MEKEKIYFYSESVEPLRLEGVLHKPAGERPPVCILCHPHPMGGGSMHVPLIVVLSEVLASRGWACLRFNFRGVGESAGRSTGGVEEVEDVEGAYRWLMDRGDVDAGDLSLAGWSFGAWVGLRWAVKAGVCRRVALVSPPLVGFDFFHFLDEEGVKLPPDRLIVCGERDQFADLGKVKELAAGMGARLHVIKGADHFLFGREREVAEAVADHWEKGA
jgi:hypothetical protein